jgi:hypothetical protein
MRANLVPDDRKVVDLGVPTLKKSSDQQEAGGGNNRYGLAKGKSHESNRYQHEATEV